MVQFGCESASCSGQMLQAASGSFPLTITHNPSSLKTNERTLSVVFSLSRGGTSCSFLQVTSKILESAGHKFTKHKTTERENLKFSLDQTHF